MVVLHLVGLTCLYLAVMLVVMAAGTLGALSLGVRNRLILLIFGMVTVGVLGIVVFWVYLIGNQVGHVVAIALMIGCALVVLAAGRRVISDGTIALLKPLLPVVAFFSASTLFSVALGYLRGGEGAPPGLAGQSRYVAGLPSDNVLPWDLIRQLQVPARPLPHYLAKPWQTSDRPPLQSGIYLLQHSIFGDGRFLDYQLISMIAQSLWIFGVWAFLVSVRLPNRAVVLGLAVTAFSWFAIQNTFYVWPKLLPGAYVMLVGAALLGSSFETLRRDRVAGLSVGLAVGCAMMGHPGSVFAVIGMALTLLILRNRPSLKLIVSASTAIVVIYVPWLLFQRYYAPPGDYLDKYQLAGNTNYNDKHTLFQALSIAYGKIGWSGALSNKWHNLYRPFENTLVFPGQVWRALIHHPWSLTGDGSVAHFVAEKSAFFCYVPAMGLMAIGIVLLLIRYVQSSLRWGRHSSVDILPVRIGFASLICLVITYLLWAGVLFGPGTTHVHVSSYYMELVGLSMGVIGWWAVSPRLCAIVVTVQSAISVWVMGYAPPHLGKPNKAISYHVQTPMLALSILMLLLSLLCLRWIVRSPDVDFEEPEERARPAQAELAGAAL